MIQDPQTGHLPNSIVETPKSAQLQQETAWIPQLLATEISLREEDHLKLLAGRDVKRGGKNKHGVLFRTYERVSGGGKKRWKESRVPWRRKVV